MINNKRINCTIGCRKMKSYVNPGKKLWKKISGMKWTNKNIFTRSVVF